MSELIIERASDNSYVFKKGGRHLNSRILDCPRARKVREHALIAAELIEVVSWLKKTAELNDQFVVASKAGITSESEQLREGIRAYFTSAIVTYQKYFTKCHGVSITPLKPEKLYDEKQLGTHRKIDELRNKLLAHVDHSELLDLKLHAISDPKGEHTPSILPTFSRSNHFIGDALEDVIRLVSFLMNEQNNMFIKSGQALMDVEFGGK